MRILGKLSSGRPKSQAFSRGCALRQCAPLCTVWAAGGPFRLGCGVWPDSVCYEIL